MYGENTRPSSNLFFNFWYKNIPKEEIYLWLYCTKKKLNHKTKKNAYKVLEMNEDRTVNLKKIIFQSGRNCIISFILHVQLNFMGVSY